MHHIRHLLTIFWMLLFLMNLSSIRIVSNILLVNATIFPIREKNGVKLHLLQYGFTLNYTTWWAHGESTTTFQHEVQPPHSMENDDLDGYTSMVMDAMGPTDYVTYNQEEQVFFFCKLLLNFNDFDA